MINNENNYKNDKNFCGSLYNGVDEILEGDGCKVDKSVLTNSETFLSHMIIGLKNLKLILLRIMKN